MKPVSILILFLIAAFFASCSGEAAIEKRYGYYQNIFGNQTPVSPQIDSLSKNLFLLNTIAYYDRYIYSQEGDQPGRIIRVEKVDKSASGTAVLLYASPEKNFLVTAAHVLDFPDTVNTRDGEGSLSSQSIKTEQKIYVIGLPLSGEVELIYKDAGTDLAFIGKNYFAGDLNKLNAWKFDYGSTDKLETGSFVLIGGFPRNIKMFSVGTVGVERENLRAGIYLDAVINKGSSGSIVMSRNPQGKFELVGFIKSNPADSRLIVVPGTDETDKLYSEYQPYSGELFIEKKYDMIYGITRIIPIEDFSEIMIQSKSIFESNGYSEIFDILSDKKFYR